MRTLLKNATVVNVFSDELLRADVLIEDERIIGVGDYAAAEADTIRDLAGKYICPGFIDGHIHIESTMLAPAEFAGAAVCHGTTAIMADPHEIANVCGTAGLDYMLQASEGLPLTVYMMLPSCVPATGFDEAGATLSAQDLQSYYAHPRVLGLAEMMNYPGVLFGAPDVWEKIRAAQELGVVINGHAPLLSGAELDKYICAGIGDDHECSSLAEAQERIRKGQRVMVRQGTAARNLADLLPLFDAPWNRRCLLVCDDKHAADLLEHGHIDDIIRQAVQAGKSAVVGIRMATLQAAEAFNLRGVGAVAPGYAADLLVLDELDAVKVADVYHRGQLVVRGGELLPFAKAQVDEAVEQTVRHSFRMDELTAQDFRIDAAASKTCRVIQLIKGQIITEEVPLTLDFAENNGIDIGRDILKLAVAERHHHTGHIGLGFIRGCGLQRGAIASSVAHDSHNLIILGTNEADMAAAGNRVRELGGGLVVAEGGRVLCELPLPIAGLMTDAAAAEVARQNEELRAAVHSLGVPADVEPLMTMSFVALPVIPHLKLTTLGLFNVDEFNLVDLFVD